MVAVRCFFDTTEQYARAWRCDLVTDQAWKVVGNPGSEGGESKGFFVRSGELRGFAKPSDLRADKFRAGHEKIAADLAFELGLPIPPVLLWCRPVEDKNKEEPYVAISMVPFLPVHKWAIVEQKPEAAQRIGGELSAAASAMVAFDTWLGNQDRNNSGNLLAGEEAIQPITGGDKEQSGKHEASTEEGGEQTEMDEEGTKAQDAAPNLTVVRAAYIDLSYSMSYQWAGDKYQNITPAPRYPTQSKLMRDELEKMIAAIEILPSKTIEDVVKRIPEEYLEKERHKVVLEGLTYRKPRLRNELKDLLQDPQGEGQQ